MLPGRPSLKYSSEQLDPISRRLVDDPRARAAFVANTTEFLAREGILVPAATCPGLRSVVKADASQDRDPAFVVTCTWDICLGLDFNIIMVLPLWMIGTEAGSSVDDEFSQMSV